MTQQRVTFQLIGMTCPGSEALQVEREIIRVPGVTRAYVNAATEKAYVDYDADRCTPEGLIAAVERAGFKAVDLDASPGLKRRDHAP
jgi:Cu+-exporting ATPase